MRTSLPRATIMNASKSRTTFSREWLSQTWLWLLSDLYITIYYWQEPQDCIYMLNMAAILRIFPNYHYLCKYN